MPTTQSAKWTDKYGIRACLGVKCNETKWTAWLWNTGSALCKQRAWRCVGRTEI